MAHSYYELADEFSLYTHDSIFLTGKAGTGKTTFLRRLSDKTQKQMAIVAPTGVAAINAGGTTIHSMFQLPFTPFIPTPEAQKSLIGGVKLRANKRKVLYELELLVIDEVSMVRADVLDAIDCMLRHFKYNHSEPFGGVQVIMIGDLFQLSPVVLPQEAQILQHYYSGFYFFHSKVYSQVKPIQIELDKVFRQQNAHFIHLLNQVRNNRLTASELAELNQLYKPNYKGNEADFAITLTTHNQLADTINSEALRQLHTAEESYYASTTGVFPEKSYPADEKLTLKVGARVMFIKNDEMQPRRFYNGKIGKVVALRRNEVVVVSPEDGEQIAVKAMEWKNVHYTVNERTKQIEEQVVGTFAQLPLRLAWGITIHKSQGLTFDKVIIDAEAAFAAGQIYVALSRCRSLEGIVLISPIVTHTLQQAADVVAFSARKNDAEQLVELLPQAKSTYCVKLFSELFTFLKQVGQIKQLERFVQEKGSFNGDTVAYLQQLVKLLEQLQITAGKFQRQLNAINLLEEASQGYLQERIQAATRYFTAHIDPLMQLCKTSPAQTDVKADAAEYDDALADLYVHLSQKRYLMHQTQHEPTIQAILRAKQQFIAPVLPQTSYAGKSKRVHISSDFPQLLQALFQLRNQLSQEQGGVPLYMVASTELLALITNYLPRTEKEIISLKGFGKAKYARFGKAILALVNSYIEEHDLEQYVEEMRLLDAEKREEQRVKELKGKSAKPPKGDTQRRSLAMYKAGNSIGKIAEERQLAATTIVGHLYTAILQGELSLAEFVEEKNLQRAYEKVEPLKDKERQKTVLHDMLSPLEQLFYYHWRRKHPDQ